MAIPMKVIRVEGEMGILELDGVRRNADFSLVAPVFVGDYVLLHSGVVISKMNEVEALKTLKLYREWEELPEVTRTI